MSGNNDTSAEESVPFYPDHVSTELRVIMGIIVIVVVTGALGMITPLGIGEPADPMDTPLHVKPEWYFLALYQLLKYIPKTTGAVIPVVLVLVLALWPFIDRKPDSSRWNTKTRLIAVTVGVIVLIAMTIWGEVS